MAFDEMDQEGKKLVSDDFETNIIGSEVVIPHVGVGSDEGKMVDYQFVDAKVDKNAKTMIIRVKMWNWTYDVEQRMTRTWDFTLDLSRHSDEYNMHPQITRLWQVGEAALESYTVFPGLRFITE
jgi:hypothetical protein